MPWGFAINAGMVLVGVILVVWVVRRLMALAARDQAQASEVRTLESLRAEDARKIAAGKAAEEVRRETRSDPDTGLPSDVRVRRTTKPIGRPVDKPPPG